MSRNRYIIRALERAVDSDVGWSARFIGELKAAQSDHEGRKVLEDMVEAISVRRTRKSPPQL